MDLKEGGPQLRNSGQVLKYEELQQQRVARQNMMVLKYRSAGSCQKPECLQIKKNSEAIKIDAIYRVIKLSLLVELDYNSVQEGINHVIVAKIATIRRLESMRTFDILFYFTCQSLHPFWVQFLLS
jgi:hypothetical protein